MTSVCLRAEPARGGAFDGIVMQSRSEDAGLCRSDIEEQERPLLWWPFLSFFFPLVARQRHSNLRQHSLSLSISLSHSLSRGTVMAVALTKEDNERRVRGDKSDGEGEESTGGGVWC